MLKAKISRREAAASLELIRPPDAPALHGDRPPAIDRAAVLTEWRRIWRVVLGGLTPIQRRALEAEMAEVQ